MKRSLLLFLTFLVLLAGCKKEKANEKPVEIPVEIPQKTESIEVKEPEPVIPKEIKVTKPTVKRPKKGLFFLEDLIGKYPTQEKIFQNKVLASRLKRMRRLNYDLLVQNWNNETPVTIENQVIHSSGCKKDHCTEGAYELFIDLKNNNINVYHFANNSLRVYAEKGFIDLPPGFKKELEKKKELAKIGSVSDDIESKYRLIVR